MARPRLLGTAVRAGILPLALGLALVGGARGAQDTAQGGARDGAQERTRDGAAAREGGITGFEANYLVFGTDSIGTAPDALDGTPGGGIGGAPDDGEADADCDVKFQLSFSRRLSAPRGMRGGRVGGMLGRDSPLFFGFTQRAWWDVCRDSAPFRETNYEPSLFLRGRPTFAGRELDLLGGYVHQSNGQGGERSIGWDRLFVRARLPLGERLGAMGFETGDRRRWLIDVTLWQPVFDGEDDAAIVRAAGYGQLVLAYTPSAESRVRLTARKGGGLGRWERGLGELDVIFPLPGTDLQGLVQYGNGYGASLERVGEHAWEIRLGVLFSDIGLP